jgi:hypothetical protein
MRACRSQEAQLAREADAARAEVAQIRKEVDSERGRFKRAIAEMKKRAEG